MPATWTPVACLREGAAAKTSLYGGPCGAAGWNFTVFGVTTFGGLNAAARSILHEVGTRIARRQAAPVPMVEDALRRAVGVAVAVEVGRQLLRTSEAGPPVANWLSLAALEDATPEAKRRRRAMLNAIDVDLEQCEAADLAAAGGQA